MTVITSTIMLAALSFGARFLLGTFVVVVVLICVLLVRGVLKFMKKIRNTDIPGFDPSSPLYMGGVINSMTANTSPGGD